MLPELAVSATVPEPAFTDPTMMSPPVSVTVTFAFAVAIVASVIPLSSLITSAPLPPLRSELSVVTAVRAVVSVAASLFR